jgi:hypothetical protein
MGVAFVYAGARVAPNHRRQTAFGLAVVGFLAVGIAVLSAITVTNYWALWADVFAALGAGAVTFAIGRGEIKLNPTSAVSI